jgi:hypothetical protein
VECYRHQAIIVELGSKVNEKVALSLPGGVRLRWSILRRYVAWNHQTTRSLCSVALGGDLVSEKIWAWRFFGKVAGPDGQGHFFVSVSRASLIRPLVALKRDHLPVRPHTLSVAHKPLR